MLREGQGSYLCKHKTEKQQVLRGLQECGFQSVLFVKECVATAVPTSKRDYVEKHDLTWVTI